MEVLGVRIDNFSKKEILEKIEFFLSEDKFHQIATVNPEFILRALKDDYFRRILNSSELNVADGIGIKYAFLRKNSWLKLRIAGVDFIEEVLRIANEKKLGVFFAITCDGLSSFKEIKNVLQKKYPNIKIGGGDLDPRKNKKWPVVYKYSIVFCNFGFPQQEKFIFQQKNDTIRIAMGVGGSFDFLTGKITRAPKLIRLFGLEWLWRLALEPRYRFKRIINAVIVFPIRVLFNR